jgi:hypothetical protein
MAPDGVLTWFEEVRRMVELAINCLTLVGLGIAIFLQLHTKKIVAKVEQALIRTEGVAGEEDRRDTEEAAVRGAGRLGA